MDSRIIRTAVRMTAVMLTFVCLFSLCSCQKTPTIEKSYSIYEVNNYVRDFLDIDIGPYIAEAEMEIEKGDSEYARIKIHLMLNADAKVTEILKAKTHVDDSPFIKIPDYKGHPYARELQDMDVYAHYIKVIQGKVASSRDTDIYTVSAENGGYVYIFG